MKPKIIDGQPLRRISYYRDKFGIFFRSFTSPTMYRYASAKRFVMLRSLFCVLRNFCKASTEYVYILRLPSWVH